jgi:hypothetical protein
MVNLVVRTHGAMAGRRGQEHRERTQELRVFKKPGIRVEPRDETMRKVLRHPNGVAFRSTGSVEWPDDRFTQKRLRVGDVKRVEETEDSKESKQKQPERQAETNDE